MTDYADLEKRLDQYASETAIPIFRESVAAIRSLLAKCEAFSARAEASEERAKASQEALRLAEKEERMRRGEDFEAGYKRGHDDCWKGRGFTPGVAALDYVAALAQEQT